jgi:hypothetical protein
MEAGKVEQEKDRSRPFASRNDAACNLRPKKLGSPVLALVKAPQIHLVPRTS